jgi:hypothetical protein
MPPGNEMPCKVWLQNLFGPIGTQVMERQAEALLERLRQPGGTATGFAATSRGEMWLDEGEIVAVLVGILPPSEQEWVLYFRNPQPGPTRSLVVPAAAPVGQSIRGQFEQYWKDRRQCYLYLKLPGICYLAIDLREILAVELRPFQPPAPAPGGPPPGRPQPSQA